MHFSFLGEIIPLSSSLFWSYIVFSLTKYIAFGLTVASVCPLSQHPPFHHHKDKIKIICIFTAVGWDKMDELTSSILKQGWV